MAVPRVKVMQAPQVKELLQSEARPSVLVVDVRDSDFEGGHIRGCLNRPAFNFDRDADVDEFIDHELTPGIKTVIMHCALSQVRGPHCAQRLQSRLNRRAEQGNAGLPDVYVMSRGWLGAAQIMAQGEDLTCACVDASCRGDH